MIFALLGAVALATQPVVVLRSDSIDAYNAPVDAFIRAVGLPTEVHDLEGDKGRAMRLADELSADPPSVVLALGAKAAWTAAHHLPPSVPVIYAQVRDPERYGLDGIQVTGVRMEMPPSLVLAQLQVLAPEVRRIGILLSAGNKDPAIAEAIAAAKAAGYQVSAQRVTSERDARRTAANLAATVDAIWILPDPVVVTPATFHAVRAQAVRARIPLLSYSEALVDAGALFCVAPDPTAIGTEAARLARQILDEQVTPGTLQPVSATRSRVVLNTEVQAAIGLRIAPEVLDFVDHTVQPERNR